MGMGGRVDGSHLSVFNGHFLRVADVTFHRADPEMVRARHNQRLDRVQLVVRKIAHLVEYAILSMLICRALAKRLAKPLPLRSLGQGVLLSIVYAAFDEWHQSWTEERFGSPIDVGIDSVGAILGTAFFAWLSSCKSRP